MSLDEDIKKLEKANKLLSLTPDDKAKEAYVRYIHSMSNNIIDAYYTPSDKQITKTYRK